MVEDGGRIFKTFLILNPVSECPLTYGGEFIDEYIDECSAFSWERVGAGIYSQPYSIRSANSIAQPPTLHYRDLRPPI
jgi:hypothetical protein